MNAKNIYLDAPLQLDPKLLERVVEKELGAEREKLVIELRREAKLLQTQIILSTLLPRSKKEKQDYKSETKEYYKPWHNAIKKANGDVDKALELYLK